MRTLSLNSEDGRAEDIMFYLKNCSVYQACSIDENITINMREHLGQVDEFELAYMLHLEKVSHLDLRHSASTRVALSHELETIDIVS